MFPIDSRLTYGDASPYPKFCCRAASGPEGGVVLETRAGVLVDPELWAGRFERFVLPLVPAWRALAGTADLCIIGSFTYDPHGWDDIDVIVLMDEDQPILEVAHDQTFYNGPVGLRVDLITLSRGALERPDSLCEAVFPAFLDSGGQVYRELCLRKKCMAFSLGLMLNFGHWIGSCPTWVAPARYATRIRFAVCVRRLLTEALCYLRDPSDRVKGVRRLLLAQQLLARAGVDHAQAAVSLRRVLRSVGEPGFPGAVGRDNISCADLLAILRELEESVNRLDLP